MDNNGLSRIARNLARSENLAAKIVAKESIINRVAASVMKLANEKVNEKKPGDSGYVAMYKGKKADVWAKTSYEAQKLAAEHFKAKKSHEVTVMLAENDKGEQVKHTPDF